MTNEITLPLPQTDLDFPLMKALANRRTKRKWGNGQLSDQELSNLLWAACGVTLEETKKSKSRRTAPSACNSQEIKIYLAMDKGVYLYDERDHKLVQVLAKDIRKNIGTQKMMQNAPIGLIYVSDYLKMKTFLFKDDNRKWFVSATDTGFISQNVYLYCAAAKLNTAILSLVDRNNLHEIMGLKDNEKIVYTQVVGKSTDS